MATTSELESFFARRCVWVNGPIIVGAGPSGLAVAACLREHGVPFVILERCDCIASLWQHRTYDRLKLHLPKKFCQLPKLAFPENFPEYPTRDQFVGYLQSYADKFDISPRFNETVLSARFDETSGLWRVRTSSEVEYICQSLVVATGENADSVVPEFEGMESFGGEVIHASDYKSGVGYRGKQVLVVGCGNSGMEVCLDLCHHGAFPSMVVRDSVHVLPREIMGRSTFELSVLMSRWIPLWLVDKILVFAAWLIFGSMSKYGLRRPAAGPLEIKKKEGKTPVLDLGALQKISSGDIKVVPAIKRFFSGSVELLDGRHVDVDSVVLATGYRSNVSSWLQDAGMFGKSGFPKASCPNNMWKGKNGLYAVGFNGRGLSGASLDAVKTAEDIASAWKEETRQTKRSISCHRRCISQI